MFYWNLIPKIFPIDNSSLLHIWNKELNGQAEQMDLEWFNMLFVNFTKYVKPVKLRLLQYRIITRSVTTNIKRSSWNKNVSKMCTFCKATPELLEHLFYYCPEFKKLWENLSRWIKYYLNVNVHLDLKMVMLNEYSQKSKDLVILLISIMKQYIYSTKCFESKLNFHAFSK